MEGIALRTSNDNQKIALRGVRLRSVVAALAERAVVEQTFVNQESVAIEAIYTFPLPDDAAVCGFEVITGDRVLTGVVEETEHAIEKYDAAINRGDAAYLLEQERPDVFTIRVGNIKPKQAATIRLTYVRPLKVVDRQIRLSYPTTVAPRYVTASGSNDPLEAQIDGDAVNPPHALHTPYGLTVEIDLDLAGVRSIDCPTHSIRVQHDGESGRRRVTFGGGLADMDRDVVLDIRLAKEQRPSVVVVQNDPARGGAGSDRADRDHFLAVTFMPEFDVEKLAAPASAETIFVLDCSGSMMGESIAQATRALELCLRSLGEGDTFNICRFGSTFELMRNEPLHYSAAALEVALRYIARASELGGTELYAPLEAILHTAPLIGGMRNIVLLTDGQVSNEPAVIQLARQHRKHNRIFAFGIGAAASANLVNGLARATGGAAEFITAAERIDEKVLRTFGRMASPMVSDVEIDWGGSDVQTLAEIPPIFDGDAVAIYARTLGSPPKEITLKCKLVGGAHDGREAKWTLPVGYAIPDTAAVVSTMWARRAIQSFEEVNGVRRTSARLREQNRDRDRLIALSKQFGLVCSLTSYIAVEHRTLAERNEGQPAVRRVPVMLAAGWGDPRQHMAMCDVLCEMADVVPSPRRRPPMAASRATARRSAPLLCKTMDRTIDRLRDSFSGDELLDGVDDTDAAHLERLSKLIAEALHIAARSIELTPEANRTRVTFIGDAGAVEKDPIPLGLYSGLIATILRLCGIDENADANQPHAGPLIAAIDGQRVTLPVNLTPTPHGSAIHIDLPPSQPGVLAAIKRKLHRARVHLIEPSSDGLMDILRSQTAAGALEHQSCDAIAFRLDVQNELSVLASGGGVNAECITTALNLLALQLWHAGRRELWQRAHAKGCRFVAETMGVKAEDVARVIDGLERKLTATGMVTPTR